MRYLNIREIEKFKRDLNIHEIEKSDIFKHMWSRENLPYLFRQAKDDTESVKEKDVHRKCKRERCT